MTYQGGLGSVVLSESNDKLLHSKVHFYVKFNNILLFLRFLAKNDHWLGKCVKIVVP